MSQVLVIRFPGDPCRFFPLMGVDPCFRRLLRDVLPGKEKAVLLCLAKVIHLYLVCGSVNRTIPDFSSEKAVLMNNHFSGNDHVIFS